MGSAAIGSLPSSFLMGMATKGTKEDQRGRESSEYGSLPPSLPADVPGLGVTLTKATGFFRVPLHAAHLWVLVALCPFRPGIVNSPHHHNPGAELCALLLSLNTASICVSRPLLNAP